ncbi:MAG: hypothetical protein KAF27_02020 [Porphyrobacter sp.]|nr:hypothetical protein [Porphyrobacter sp.]
MSLRTIILLAVLGLPYGALALKWAACLAGGAQIDGHLIFYTLAALVALPFVMAIMGGTLALGGARRVASAAGPRRAGGRAEDRIIEGTRGGVRLWIGMAVLLSALPACAAILFLLLDTPEPGRDRLGRICETDGGTTTCRPDPDADRPSEIDMLNVAIKRQRDKAGR